jgi:hypothetical protein
MNGRLAQTWQQWTVIAHKIGNFQARLFLVIFYFVIAPLFALIVKLFKDPLTLNSPQKESLWVEGPVADRSLSAARKQF